MGCTEQYWAVHCPGPGPGDPGGPGGPGGKSVSSDPHGQVVRGN